MASTLFSCSRAQNMLGFMCRYKFQFTTWFRDCLFRPYLLLKFSIHSLAFIFFVSLFLCSISSLFAYFSLFPLCFPFLLYPHLTPYIPFHRPFLLSIKNPSSDVIMSEEHSNRNFGWRLINDRIKSVEVLQNIEVSQDLPPISYPKAFAN